MVPSGCRGQSELSQVQTSASETQIERRYDPKRAVCGETAAKGVRKARKSAQQNFWLKVAKAAKVLHPGEPKAAKVLTCQDWAKIAKVTHLSKPYRPPVNREPTRATNVAFLGTSLRDSGEATAKCTSK